MGLWFTRPTRLLNTAGLMYVLGTSLIQTAAAQEKQAVDEFAGSALRERILCVKQNLFDSS